MRPLSAPATVGAAAAALAVTAMAALAISLSSCHPAADGGNSAFHFIDTAQLDAAILPGDDFFSYANGKWLETAKIPPTEAGTGTGFDVVLSTNARLRNILDSVSKANSPKGSIEQKVGDLYASGMDSATIEKKGAEPVKRYLRQIDSIRDAQGIMGFVAFYQRQNGNPLFVVSFGPDDKNSRVNIASFSQGGLGLPDRDYYFKTDSATIRMQRVYQNIVSTVFVLTGAGPAAAAGSAEKVYNLEKQLAAGHKTNVQLRDPQDNYHKMALASLDRSMPSFGWKQTLEAMGIQADSVNVQQPDFFFKADHLLKSVPSEVWKDYLKAQVLLQYANRLSSDFVNARFAYVRALYGQQQLQPRSERMADVVDLCLGEALGQLYVKRYFSPEDKQRMLELVGNLQKAFAARIDKLDWMSDSTKQKAKQKLFAFIKKIGYPDKWRDYSKVTIDRNDYFGNRLSADINEYNYQLAKLGKHVDRTEWRITPPTVDAFYSAYYNEIVFPAGILQPPFFDPAADDAVNYGAIGEIIGHEMTHGFDDQGAQYDKDGNLRNWWGREDGARFSGKTKSVVALYSGFTILDTLHINGALTNGENIADIGGLAIAYDAFKLTPEGHDSTKIEGFTPDQRFCLSLARVWRIKEKDELVRTLVNTDPHSPAKWRVNGPLMNLPTFYTAFNVQPGERMYRPDSARIRIW